MCTAGRGSSIRFARLDGVSAGDWKSAKWQRAKGPKGEAVSEVDGIAGQLWDTPFWNAWLTGRTAYSGPLPMTLGEYLAAHTPTKGQYVDPLPNSETMTVSLGTGVSGGVFWISAHVPVAKFDALRAQLPQVEMRSIFSNIEPLLITLTA